jgi:hypothetical protein
MFVAGSQTAAANPLSYELSFRVSSLSSGVNISYNAETTIPGTNLDEVLLLTYPGPVPSVSGFRDGAWSFTIGFATTSFTYIAQPDTAFANLPGLYLGLPALFVTRFGESSPGTVDISIESVPEPKTSFLIAAELVVFVGLCRLRKSGMAVTLA